MTSFGARVCTVEICLEPWILFMSWSYGIKLPSKLPQTQSTMPTCFKLLAKIKLIPKLNNWTYISMITTLNVQNHISGNCIGSVIIFFILTQVQFVYMERYDSDRHTRLNKRSNGWLCISEQQPSPGVKRTVCRAQKHVCAKPHIWGRVQKKILLHWWFTEEWCLCYP